MFRYLYGAVYIFENIKAQRVKIGMTTDSIANRLNDINDIWLDRKVTCQICGIRLVNLHGYVPPHVVSGKKCPGGLKLPLEEDVSIAETFLENMMSQVDQLSGSEKGSFIKRINTLEVRIENYLNYRKEGMWEFSIAFLTENAEDVELRSHEILAESLDKKSPIGEVFCCSVSEAANAVEKALIERESLHLAKKITKLS